MDLDKGGRGGQSEIKQQDNSWWRLSIQVVIHTRFIISGGDLIFIIER